MGYLLSRDVFFWVPLIFLIAGYILAINMTVCIAQGKGKKFSSLYVILMAILALVAMLTNSIQDPFNGGFRILVSFSSIFSINALFSAIIVAIASGRITKLPGMFTIISLIFTDVSLLLTTIALAWKYFF